MYVVFLQGSYKKLLNYTKGAQASKPVRQCERTCICVSGCTRFLFVVQQILGGKRLWGPFCMSERWCPQEQLFLFKLFFCFLSITLCSVPSVFHRCSDTLQPLFHVAGIVKCGPSSSRVLYLLILYNVKSYWPSGICLVSFIVHVIHHHSTVMKFYRVQHQPCGIAPLLEGLVSWYGDVILSKKIRRQHSVILGMRIIPLKVVGAILSNSSETFVLNWNIEPDGICTKDDRKNAVLTVKFHFACHPC